MTMLSASFETAAGGTMPRRAGSKFDVPALVHGPGGRQREVKDDLRQSRFPRVSIRRAVAKKVSIHAVLRYMHFTSFRQQELT